MNIVKRQKIMSIMIAIVTLWSQTVWALPQGGTVVGGNSTITQPNSTTMHINQTTDKSIINWQGYSIAANEKVQYFQPSSSSISLNRVIGVDLSYIYGQISANGRVWVINPNGLLIGNGANINVGSFVGSTLNIGNEDFMNGNYVFRAMSNQPSTISNLGNITANNGGYVVLISPSITNEGNITSNLGKTYLASGDEVTLNFAGNELIGFTIDRAVAEGVIASEAKQSQIGITNLGTITANGGEVILSAKAAGDLFKTVINNEGVIEAKTIENRNGVIKLLGGMENNSIKVSGTLDASALDGGDGGFIETSAAKVKIEDNAKITTYAPRGKTGTWLIDPNDYTIAASGGDITGATLSTNLGSNNVTILSSSGATGINGDVNVNDAVSWSANTLTLTAARDININAVMTASGTSALALNTATANGADAAVLGGTVKVGFDSNGAFKGRVDFGARSGTGFLSMNGNVYIVINSLGAAGSVTGTDLQGMSGNLAGYYALGSNIDATATSGWNAGLGFLPIGGCCSLATAFTGTFEGLGHTITGLTINRPSTGYAGLFGYAGYVAFPSNAITPAAIRDVGLVGGSVSGNFDVGGLVGYLRTGSTVANSYNTGTVSGTLAGSTVNAGGLVGAGDGNISNSYSTGNVSASAGNQVGGLVGSASGTITNSYSTGNVSGGNWVGGLVGATGGFAVIARDYSTGSVTGNSSVGGLAGYYSSAAAGITNSYSTGVVNGSIYVGGLVGWNDGNSISNSFWDTTTSGLATGVGFGFTAGATGMATAQMKTMASFAGWDIANTGGSNAVWRIYEGNTYPLLKSFLTPLTITANNASKTYDGLAYSGGNGVTYSLASPVLSGTLTYGGTSQGAINAGSYAITPGGYWSNQQGYDISYVNGVLTINTLAVVVALSGNKVYDGTPTFSTGQLGISNIVSGDVVSLSAGTASAADQNAAANKPFVSFSGLALTGASAGNYTLTGVSGTGTITPAPLTITGVVADNKVYDGSTRATLNSSSVPSLIGLVPGESLNVSFPLVGDFADKNAGTGKTVTASGYSIGSKGGAGGGLAPNYQLSSTSVTTTADITPAPLTITANAASKTYGDANPALTARYTGLVSGETSSVVSGLSLSTTATTTSGAGDYPITASGASASNYIITYVDGVLTIIPATTGGTITTTVLQEWLGDNAEQNKTGSKINKLLSRTSNFEDLFITEASYVDEIFTDKPETCILECE